jgi:4-hydroxybenzoate polyprenyltransferase
LKTVETPPSERRKRRDGSHLHAVGANELHQTEQEWQLKPPATGLAILPVLLKAMRPKQWLKNGLLFVAPVAALRITNVETMLQVGAAFLLFCLVSSAIYLINDLVDIEADRHHTKKRNRPLASGKLPVIVAQVVAVLLLGVMIPIALFLGPTITFGLIVVAYVVNALLYDFFFKHVVLVDLFSLSAGFVLRVMGGALVIGVSISPWLYLVTILAALFIGVNKRRHELVLLEHGAGKHRPILDEYSPGLLDQLTSTLTAATIIAYSLYTWQGETVSKKNNLMMATIPFAIYAVFRYLYLIYQRDEGGAPEELLTRDLPLIIDVVLWGITALVILYFFKDVTISL